MPEFVLDGASSPDFIALPSFVQGYVEAMFFTCEEELGDKGFTDLAPETLVEIAAQCEAFQDENKHLLAEAYARDYDEAQAGRDFWYTRCGHGVGYWDRKELEADRLGTRLTGAAHLAGEVWVYEGDNGQIFLS